MPEVVSQVEGSNPNVRTAKKNGGYKSWKVNPDLFPCELPKELQKEADEAVQVRGAATETACGRSNWLLRTIVARASVTALMTDCMLYVLIP